MAEVVGAIKTTEGAATVEAEAAVAVATAVEAATTIIIKAIGFITIIIKAIQTLECAGTDGTQTDSRDRKRSLGNQQQVIR